MQKHSLCSESLNSITINHENAKDKHPILSSYFKLQNKVAIELPDLPLKHSVLM